jgi:hypothetical protein
MQWTSLELVNQAMTSLMLGFGLALLNVVARYFAPFIPHVITVLGWRGGRWRFSIILLAAYLVALVFQLATSPLFRSLIHSVYAELAWSPYEALFNVLGVIVMDLFVEAWRMARRGATVGQQQISEARVRAADAIGDMNIPVDMSDEERAAHRQAQEEAAARTAAERKQRMDEKLKNY